MRNRVCCLALHRKCTCATGVCASSHAAATARFQSVQSLYGASTELQAHHADNTKRRSRICGYAVDQRTLTANGCSLSSTDLSRKTALGPPPGPLRGRPFSAGVLFLLLRALRIRLWLRVAVGMGWILVSNVALLVTEKLFPRKKARRRHSLG